MSSFESTVGALIVAMLMGAGPAMAADATTTGVRELRGAVVDSSGSAVPGAEVTLRRDVAGVFLRTQTDGAGLFALQAPGDGAYELTAAADGFSVSRQPVAFPGRAADVRLVLKPGVFTDSVEVIGSRLAGSAETVERMPGSVDVIDKETMDSSRVLNINETLRKAPGLNVRDEEGFALRPNIGIRGLNPTRSTKVLLLEDGLFLTYAPYGDNASYYHPPVERFGGIEVVKGSGQIAYGPVTVGGVINYLTPDPPATTSGQVRLSGGNRDYLSGQATGGGTWGRTAVLAEFMHKQGDGSRDNIHSVLEDANLKGVFSLSSRHTLTAKANYYREDSDIAYSGLTLAEWTTNPRANPFVNDHFDGRRAGASLKHNWLIGSEAVLTTQVYGSRFSRDWWRQSSNSGQRPNDRADANCGGMENLLTTCGNEGRLRDYSFYGVEPRLRFGHRLFGVRSEGEVGVRAHFETQERLQRNGDTPTARTGILAEDNRRENSARSAFVQERLLLGPVTFSAGVRFESVDYERTNRLANGGTGASGTTEVSQWVPGAGVSWSASQKLNLFAGVHRGFAPPRTEDVISQTGGVVDLDAEKSWNYEAGLRSLPMAGIRLDATLFRNDYENQVVPASLAGGVGATLTNGGATLHEGYEIAARLNSAPLTGSSHDVYVRLAFTGVPTARFEGVRLSSVAGFTNVSVSGNRLPYAPESFLTAAVGYLHPRGFSAQLEAVHVTEQFADDLNTVASSPDGQRGLIEGYAIWNATLIYDLKSLGSTVSVSAKNITDELYLVDRSRGMIPGPPRTVQLGVSKRF